MGLALPAIMADLESALDAIGLVELYGVLRAQGFETWQQLLDVSEDDLIHCRIKLGHRRRLQRAIQDSLHGSNVARLQRQAPFLAVNDQSQGDRVARPSQNAQSPHSSATASEYSGGSPEAQHSIPKRKYRRHPKPDENAPERPPSAYVMFSNRIRERLKDQDLSFTTIAKLVGEQWQNPDPEERALCEREAQQRKEIFYAQLAEYKKTPEYAAYQEYLEDFKAKHGDHNNRGSKRNRGREGDSYDEPMNGVGGPSDTPPSLDSSTTPSSLEVAVPATWHLDPRAHENDAARIDYNVPRIANLSLTKRDELVREAWSSSSGHDESDASRHVRPWPNDRDLGPSALPSPLTLAPRYAPQPDSHLRTLPPPPLLNSGPPPSQQRQPAHGALLGGFRGLVGQQHDAAVPSHHHHDDDDDVELPPIDWRRGFATQDQAGGHTHPDQRPPN